MIVVFKKNILDKIDDEISKANQIGRVIQRIYLDDCEFEEYKYLRGFGLHEEYKGIEILYFIGSNLMEKTK